LSDEDVPENPADSQSAENKTDEIPNAADPASQKRAKRKADRRQEEAEEFWQRVFADPIGRREMWGLLQTTHAFETKFACGPNGFPQPESTWFEAGIQSIGDRLWKSWLLMARDGALLMQDEHDPRFAERAKRKAPIG